VEVRPFEVATLSQKFTWGGISVMITLVIGLATRVEEGGAHIRGYMRLVKDDTFHPRLGIIFIWIGGFDGFGKQ
jgi:hypothetical protein